MNILVVIVTYNAMQWLKKCLDSIKSSSVPLKMFVVDNGSLDGTQKYIIENYPEVIFIQSNQNLGFGKANNIGIQYAIEHDYDYVYLLNQDAWIMPETIQRLVDCQQRNPTFGILSPFQLQANMQHLDTNFNQICAECKEFIDDIYFNHVKDIYSVDTVMAAHWLISKECLLKVGGFSPTFPHYGEDKNYTNRVHFHNLNVGIVPNVIAVHDRSDRKTSVVQKIYMEYIGMLIDLSKIYLPQSHRFLRILQRALRVAVTYKSLKGFTNLLKVLFSYRSINNNRKCSKTDKAFLK